MRGGKERKGSKEHLIKAETRDFGILLHFLMEYVEEMSPFFPLVNVCVCVDLARKPILLSSVAVKLQQISTFLEAT